MRSPGEVANIWCNGPQEECEEAALRRAREEMGWPEAVLVRTVLVPSGLLGVVVAANAEAAERARQRAPRRPALKRVPGSEARL